MFKRKIIIDAILNIIATAIPIIIIQLIILPIIGKKLGNVQYGLVVTLVSLSTILSQPFGNVLNNIRLITHTEYERNNITGDFNILLLGAIIINIFTIFIGTIYYEGAFSIISIILMIILSCLDLIRGYLIVSFRIILNYKAIVINNFILGIGYLLGLILFIITGYWQFIYIIGSTLSLYYIIKHSKLLKEKLTKTSLFKSTFYKSFILFLSSFMGNVLSYADKLLIFPLLGPTAVSIYYSATLLGKVISMAIMPINSVMLSYLAKMEKMKMNTFIYVIFLTLVVGVIVYFVTLLISRPVLYLLYPSWAKESMGLVPVTTATVTIDIISSVINPIILRFNNVNWQIFINGTNLIIYVIFVFIFYNLYGLFGFSIGVLSASLIKLLLMISIYIYYYCKTTKVNIVDV